MAFEIFRPVVLNGKGLSDLKDTKIVIYILIKLLPIHTYDKEDYHMSRVKIR